MEEYQHRMAERRQKALKTGKVMFRPPFGYTAMDGKLVVDEKNRELVKNILEHLDNGWTPLLISAKFAVPPSRVRRIRNNPIYRTGEVRYAGEVVFKVEPILPKVGKQ
jgi:DNA invertase Pin-like site-specific DNA recombinase